MTYLRKIRVTKIEYRPKDAWFDMSLRQMREGEVRFYRVKDFITGEWLFKVCLDKELGKFAVKAIKCPAGRHFAQLEGDTMLFQKSAIEGLLYDIISVTYVDENGRVRKNICGSVDEIPSVIQESFEVKPYKEATGRRVPGRRWVTISKEGDEKAMITLFLLERAWPISPVSPEEILKTLNLLTIIKNLEKATIEEIYRAASQQFGIDKETANILLISLEKRGEIERPEAGFIKTVKQS